MLADAAREHERVQSVHGGCHGRDPGAEMVHVDLEAEPSIPLPLPRPRPRDDLSHVGRPGEPEQAGAVLQGWRGNVPVYEPLPCRRVAGRLGRHWLSPVGERGDRLDRYEQPTR
jgi:hypothetical protein